MEIRDVIGSLRLRDLELQRKIDALRLDVHLLWQCVFDADKGPVYIVSPKAVSRETKEEDSGTDATQPTLPGL